jgi:citrate lyase subunit beta/citryl-CoA lyase
LHLQAASRGGRFLEGDIVENKPRIIRSMGFVPAHEADAIVAAAEASGLDAIGPDLEDLTPGKYKQQARDIFRDVAKAVTAKGITMMARVNVFDNGCEADLNAVVCPELHCVNMSKAESAEDVRRFCQLLDKAEANAGLPQGYTLVRPVIETAKGIKFAYEIAEASDRISYMGGVAGGFWGDLGGTLGLIPGDGSETLFLRSKVLVDVRAAGVPFPLGGGMPGDRSPENIRSYMTQTKNLGYTGVFCPANKDIVDIVHEVFTPTKEEIAQWQETIPLLEEAQREGTVAWKVGDKTYDTAGLQRVKDQMELAKRLGMV